MRINVKTIAWIMLVVALGLLGLVLAIDVLVLVMD